ncbi:hypothetical protein VNO78_02746 [Psophocarpus tetragonolobus]|uniref:Uncharacterized protein n=1 Tax=Psophocarpus tetragonolobus TaxID=3891 RepID=A0AAN9T310_PSOTE
MSRSFTCRVQPKFKFRFCRMVFPKSCPCPAEALHATFIVFLFQVTEWLFSFIIWIVFLPPLSPLIELTHSLHSAY